MKDAGERKRELQRLLLRELERTHDGAYLQAIAALGPALHLMETRKKRGRPPNFDHWRVLYMGMLIQKKPELVEGEAAKLAYPDNTIKTGVPSKRRTLVRAYRKLRNERAFKAAVVAMLDQEEHFGPAIYPDCDSTLIKADGVDDILDVLCPFKIGRKF